MNNSRVYVTHGTIRGNSFVSFERIGIESEIRLFRGQSMVLIDDEHGIDVCRNALQVMFVCYDIKKKKASLLVRHK